MQKFKIGQVVNVKIKNDNYEIKCKGTIVEYIGEHLIFQYRVTLDEDGVLQYNSYQNYQLPLDYQFLIAEIEMSEIPKRSHKARQLQIGDKVRVISKDLFSQYKKVLTVTNISDSIWPYELADENGKSTGLYYRHEIQYVPEKETEIKNRHYETLMNFDDSWGGFFSFLGDNNIVNVWENGCAPTHVSEQKQMIYSLMLCMNDEDLDVFLNELKNCNS